MSVFSDPALGPVESALKDIPLPDCESVSVADCVVDASLNGEKLSLNVQVGYPAVGVSVALAEAIKAKLAPREVDLSLNWAVPLTQADENKAGIPGVKHIIAVASGKGGVGKSTTAVNLALALKEEGASVGILDADIYGPSMQQMLGVVGVRPEMRSQQVIQPIEAHGLGMISMGNLVTKGTPMVWRGPMASGALQQMFQNTHWEGIDYLIVDMPPGTGDIQLTLSQSVPVAGAVIVTTPQDIALIDAERGIEMFQKVSIPPLGIVENMSTHICSKCGHEEAIFGSEGGVNLSKKYGVDLLGQLPLQMDIRLLADGGKPSVAADPNSKVSQTYRSIARKMTAKLWLQSLSAQQAPVISFTDD